ncbi:Putative rossmann-like alpha/beta/alpha sandwich protein [Septoria linicola]|uniref:Rossmann-like alpha/beta/alpha sandwich protein n=1 Tax=Septoria linicola TaxID=215465 RepID=A0A9Q9B1H8_9PEZI|nr:putative rossmann-like alpha/beta/alpha sandwich protein [Septoria linicola]USW55551.1 Putative rossmann-like alpha/beta/alpha sandwich protein [Septoria linicola]
MSNNPSPRSGTPVQHASGSAHASPRSQPAASEPFLPTRSIPSAPLDASANGSSSTVNPANFVPPWRRPTIAIDGNSDAARRPSVQFVPHVSNSGSRSSSANPPSVRRSIVGSITGKAPSTIARRLSSPPPPAQFRSSVSFDTFANPAASDFSLTLNRKHRDYEYTKRSRTFLCGTDTNEYSDTALEWLIDELVDDGDEVVCLRVVEKDSKEASLWSRGQGNAGYRKEAERFLEEIEKKNTDDRAISLILEFSIGGIQDTIQKMIRIYEPAMLVVGTRGRSLTGYQGLLSSGSVSKYCLQYSPVPVIVVRPSSKREAKKRKRLQDPSRSGYRDILDKSDDAPRGRGTHLLDEKNRLSIMGTELGALGQMDAHDDEARRVAEAIGYRHVVSDPHEAAGRGSSLSRMSSVGSEGHTSPPGRLLKSPELGVVDSPPGSDDEDPDYDDEMDENLSPEAEALQIARERALQVSQEVQEDKEDRKKRATSRGRNSRGNADDDEASGGGSGAAVLDIFEKLNKGVR